MASANPLWGAPRIHGELRKLGVEVSERTVSRFVRRRPRPRSQTWRTFLTSHFSALVSMDFFTVPTLTGRILFVLVLLAQRPTRNHDRSSSSGDRSSQPTALKTSRPGFGGGQPEF
jgi:hypothetical protein